MSSYDPSPPRASFATRYIFREIWCMLWTGYAVLLFAGLFPLDFRNESSGHALLAWFAIWVRNYTFHIGLLFAALAGIALLGRRFALVVCTVPLLLLSVVQELRDFQDKPKQTAAGETVTVMTFNLRKSNQDTAAVLAEIEQADPDVLLLQEYTTRWHEELHETLEKKYAYPLRPKKLRDDPYGIAVYSRHHARGQSFRLGNVSAPQIRIVLLLDDREVALYNLHLFAPLRLDCATANRLQFADLMDQLAKEKLPAIVAGDFNFTHRSPQGRLLANQGWAEAHAQAGKGRGGTWRTPKLQWLPPLRMDHVYLSPQLVCIECRNGQPAGSDHLPVIAKIGFAAESHSEGSKQRPEKDKKAENSEPGPNSEGAGDSPKP